MDSRTGDAREDGQVSVLTKPAFEARAVGSVSGGNDNLFYPYVVPVGRYDLHVQLDGMTQTLPVCEGIEIQEGRILRFDIGF